MTDTVEEIQLTLLTNARPGISVEELFRLTQKAHPAASKKDITRAAIGSLIAIADSDLERALVLQNFAIRGRGVED